MGTTNKEMIMFKKLVLMILPVLLTSGCVFRTIPDSIVENQNPPEEGLTIIEIRY